MVLQHFCLHSLAISYDDHETVIIPVFFEENIKTSSVFDTRMKQKVIIRSSTWEPGVINFRESIVFEAPDEYKNRQPRVLFDGL